MESFMHAALQEAKRGLGHTSPNPAVGAVIVRGNRILARGFHRQAGQPHAEIEALNALHTELGTADASRKTRGATLFVTLEPCSTHGRTPPCVDAIIKAGFKYVVIGAVDPNPAHAGRGIHLLRAAGIEVVQGVLEPECRNLNRAFNHWIVTGQPYVIAKAGMSLDGRLTRPPGEGQWLTGSAARSDAMRLRASVDAILIGANTLRADNPRLTVRGIRGARQPWRIVLAGKSALPKKAHLFTDEFRERTLVFRNRTLRSVLGELGRKKITSVMIEGGMRVLGQAFDGGWVHEVQFYLADLLCGGPVLAVGGRGAGFTAESWAISAPTYRRVGGDIVVAGPLERPAA